MQGHLANSADPGQASQGATIGPESVLFEFTGPYIVTGRLQALELNIEERDLIILNMYRPSTDSVNHFKILENYLKENDDKTFIIGGDFKTILDTELDKKNG